MKKFKINKNYIEFKHSVVVSVRHSIVYERTVVH
jgi:hypothetical protein